MANGEGLALGLSEVARAFARARAAASERLEREEERRRREAAEAAQLAQRQQELALRQRQADIAAERARAEMERAQALAERNEMEDILNIQLKRLDNAISLLDDQIDSLNSDASTLRRAGLFDRAAEIERQIAGLNNQRVHLFEQRDNLLSSFALGGRLPDVTKIRPTSTGIKPPPSSALQPEQPEETPTTATAPTLSELLAERQTGEARRDVAEQANEALRGFLLDSDRLGLSGAFFTTFDNLRRLDEVVSPGEEQSPEITQALGRLSQLLTSEAQRRVASLNPTEIGTFQADMGNLAQFFRAEGQEEVAQIFDDLAQKAPQIAEENARRSLQIKVEETKALTGARQEARPVAPRARGGRGRTRRPVGQLELTEEQSQRAANRALIITNSIKARLDAAENRDAELDEILDDLNRRSARAKRENNIVELTAINSVLEALLGGPEPQQLKRAEREQMPTFEIPPPSSIFSPVRPTAPRPAYPSG